MTDPTRPDPARPTGLPPHVPVQPDKNDGVTDTLEEVGDDAINSVEESVEELFGVDRPPKPPGKV
ncbi:hypothetical protein [Chitinimonas koreensis]|uniref:hypothetical protein n=1 Tax=Chitinimonas koreensis TaxID=356302 RepID=UPI000400F883|nr:hypothetical protein [Chitinimonas koreensis]QNM95699.1 hypothetical protein H9L41_17850 [Chitinimonas koreensis]